MGLSEHPSFYLDSIEYSPKVLTLGTLVYGNYAMPEKRSVSFPRLIDREFRDLEGQGDIIVQSVSGCFISNNKSRFGIGVRVAEVAELDIQYVRECEKLVEAKERKRLVLRSPDTFFEKVLQDPVVLKKLGVWLTAAKSAYVFYKATFQKPRVFCLTGYYEMSDVKARVQGNTAVASTVTVSSGIVAAASCIPVGGRIGPSSNGQTLQANISISGPCVWAARFHELKVDYIQMATAGMIDISRMITLLDDCTHPRGGLMGSEPVVQKTRVVNEADDIKHAQYVATALGEVNEVADKAERDREYWQAFDAAASRLDSVGQEIVYGVDSSDEDGEES